MNVTVKLRNLRIAPRKVRLVADLVRGRKAADAVADLEFRAKRAALPVKKLIQSAIAAATNNHKLDKDALVVSAVTVDDGLTYKRFRPRAFGRAATIRKRGSHVTLTVSDGAPSAAVPATTEKKQAETETKKSEDKAKKTPSAVTKSATKAKAK